MERMKKEIIKDEISEQQNILRPTKMDSYIGQEHIKDSLNIAISACKKRNETLDHIIFYGPPGLGKTTISNIIANEMESNIKIINGPSIEKSGDLAMILTSLEHGDILFIDEIHRIPRQIEEILYSAMEDFYLDIIVNNNNSSEPIRINLEKFTLIGATTRIGMLTTPLRDRFGFSFRMKYYNHEEMSLILQNASKILEKKIDTKATLFISENSRGTPRVALNLLKRVRDYSDFKNNDLITKELTEECFKKIGIFEYGLDELDLKYLKVFKNSSKPIGLKTLSANLSEDIRTIEDVIEPFLIQEGFIEITTKGRILTDKGIELKI